MTQPLILAEGLTRIYPMGNHSVTGLDRIDFRVAEGEFLVLKGISGSGKSTLLSLLAGLDSPTAGELTVSGIALHSKAAEDLTRYRREVVGMVFQSFNLLPTLTVLENISLPALMAGKPANAVEKRAAELLDWLDLASRMGHRPAQLSGGEMQRTAIARALINDPAIVLADEPTGNLDTGNGQRVIHLLSELHRERGRTLIIATHSDLADPFATRRLYLKDGRLGDPSSDLSRTP
ncbi:MAG: ABC transporter ATP-binding protein [Thermodesulfobacteriota bacterium]